MKVIIAICFLAFAAVALARPNDEKYTSQYDNINLTEILANQKLLFSYFNCILGKGKCTAEGKALLSNMKDAMQNKCAKCTERQRDGSKQVLSHLINKEPAMWQELKDKYDPENKLAKMYEEELKELKH